MFILSRNTMQMGTMPCCFGSEPWLYDTGGVCGYSIKANSGGSAPNHDNKLSSTCYGRIEQITLEKHVVLHVDWNHNYRICSHSQKLLKIQVLTRHPAYRRWFLLISIVQMPVNIMPMQKSWLIVRRPNMEPS